MKSAHHLLIVGADASANHALSRQLALYDEYAVGHAAGAEDGLRLLALQRFAAVLVDAPLPDLDATEFCRSARRQCTCMPLIVLGAASESDGILALDAGAIDYVAKPVRFIVLIARLRAHLRQYEASEAASVPMGRFLLHSGQRLLSDMVSGSEISLTNRETDLLKYLYRAAGRPVSRERLLAEVWGYHAGADTHTVQTHVHRLRRKVGDDPRTGSLIVTDGGGYRLAASVTAGRSAARA